MTPSRIPSLRSVVLHETGQDVHRCQGCLLCDETINVGMDIPLGSLIQLVMANDDEVLTSQTLWSEPILELARSACTKNLNLAQIILALRREAIKRGVRE